MGTEVHSKSYFPGFYSMRDINEDSNGSWALFYGDKTLTNGQYYNGFLPRTVSDTYSGYEKDLLKQKMLEHEAIFKNQVYELHRLYRRQRDMMEEVKRKELHKRRILIEASSSSSFLPSQMPAEDAQRWHIPTFPLPGCSKPSIVGAEVISSPLSCTNGSSRQAGRVPSQNGPTSNDCEVLESRPSKVRKKLFDLQLLADEYIDNEESQHFSDKKISENGSCPPKRNNRIAPSGVTSDSCSRDSLRVADLNDPVQVEAAAAPTSVDFFGHSRSVYHGDVRGLDVYTKPKAQLLGLPQGLVENFQQQTNETSISLSTENKGCGRERFSFLYEAGNSKGNPNYISQSSQPDKLQRPSNSMQFMLNKAHQLPGISATDHSRGDMWRDRTGCVDSHSSRDHNYNSPEPIAASCISTPYSFVNSSDMANSWSQSAPAWVKPSSSFTQKLTSVQAHLPFDSPASFSRNTQSSNANHEIFGDKWRADGGSRLNAGWGSIPNRNGFYHGSASGSKEVLPVCFPSIGFHHLHGTNGEDVTSERVNNHESEKLFMELNCVKDVNLNVVPKTSSGDAVPQHDFIEIIDVESKQQNPLPVLPWLQAKPACKNETGEGPNLDFRQKVTSASTSYDVRAKKDTTRNEYPGSRKNLGFPIFQNTRNDSSSLVSTSASLRCPPESDELKTLLIDINVACDPAVPDFGEQITVAKEGTDTKLTNFRNRFDLNSVMSEDEDPYASCVSSNNPTSKRLVEIDLEVPAFPEAEETMPSEECEQHEAPLKQPQQKPKHLEDEFLRIAAEAIVAISSSVESICPPSETSFAGKDVDADPLLWFVEVVSSFPDDLDSKFRKECQIDEFEAMTLQLMEMKEEDYMPKPFIPEGQEAEEAGPTSLPNRTRKGPARRGRQRRDFQRDILPGLTSLSRHEVAEDLQIFGGLMRATGHQWQSGSTRRNGVARGRRRLVVDPGPTSSPCTPLVQQVNKNIEVGLEDRSLTGWGKTTRRPRRQRCPAGNPLAVAI